MTKQNAMPCERSLGQQTQKWLHRVQLLQAIWFPELYVFLYLWYAIWPQSSAEVIWSLVIICIRVQLLLPTPPYLISVLYSIAYTILRITSYLLTLTTSPVTPSFIIKVIVNSEWTLASLQCFLAFYKFISATAEQFRSSLF